MSLSSANTVPMDRPVSFIGGLMSFIGRVFGVLLLSILVSIMVEWCMILFIRELPLGTPLYQPARAMFEYELQFISAYVDNFDDIAITGNWMIQAQAVMGTVIRFLFIDSGILHYFLTLEQLQTNEFDITRFFKSMLAMYRDFFISATYILMMFCVRLTILILSSPIFIIFGVVGACDGLMQRDVRRWTAGNESSYVYHFAKRFAFPVLVLGMLLYLSAPYSIHPNVVLLPTAIGFALTVMVMTSKFKKYL